MKRALLPLLALLLLSSPALAQEPAPTPPCDPAARACLTSQNWLGSIAVSSPGVETRLLPFARSQAELLVKGWSFGARLDLFAQPGKEIKSLDFRTASTVEAHLLATRYLLSLPGRIRIGLAAAVGAALVLGDGRPEFPKSLTAGLGFRVTGPRMWGACIVGQNQETRGVGGKCAWEAVPKEGSHFANIGTLSIGRRLVPVAPGLEDAPDPSGLLRSELTYVLGTGIAARF